MHNLEGLKSFNGFPDFDPIAIGTQPFQRPEQVKQDLRKATLGGASRTYTASAVPTRQRHLVALVPEAPSYLLSPAPRPHVCRQCSARFVEHRQLTNHEHNAHKRYACHVQGCQMEYRHPKSLWQHRKEAHEKVVYRCDICDYSSGRKPNLKRHKVNKHKYKY
ncbi:hypothetical protein CC78DRAFT_321064 [Lojkania enalia]|uniref:C2H2-type domain-containing protein n=1 Tax=Lojkania enalia TaxID=147567 RepID=A0A9P4K9B7_9PLEO|nr:hypothetical protein CC78DRAFT_321064 [Didymosphaeria enalia]